jgi:hypothetical protein
MFYTLTEKCTRNPPVVKCLKVDESKLLSSFPDGIFQPCTLDYAFIHPLR